MLDPKEQAKGGFRAHVAREQERQDVLAAARLAAEGQAGSTPPAAGAAEAERSPYSADVPPRDAP
jgi:hypothetical protein